MSTSICRTYVLEVPATKEDIGNLLLRLIRESEFLNERVHLEFGTSRLLCRNEREREEHRDRVTVREAMNVLVLAMDVGNGGEVTESS